ncbi:hypothetical protein FRT60_07395 [Pseudomonas haemolytica]|uniref:Uncharacterized protein n=1 Tax=Pseudomonas haemolytica TaxID=2600065 RepID=A0A646NW70_9PSED|nr:hypothetical protein [Pseudomonas haemolytica]MRJ20164.1 hypothetical protein [Pseudomonas haemolytica]
MNNQDEHKSRYCSANFIQDPWQLFKRYMPVIGGDALAGCFSIALTAILTVLTYLSTYPIGFATKTSLFSAMGLGAVFAIAKAEVLYGRINWVWINVGIYLTCLLISLPTITYAPNIYIYVMAALSPLFGLLMLNSKRCRELRQKSVEIRQQRQAIVTTLKQQGRWKWW